MTDHAVAPVDDIPENERLLVEIEGKEVVVFNVDGEFYAHVNWCAHQGGPVCEGTLSGSVTAEFDRDTLDVNQEWVNDGTVVGCPWHNWEFDVTTGECLSNQRVTLISYPVTVENGTVVVST